MLAEHIRMDRKGQRRGVLLIVVLALLSLFAIVGITFVFFAGQKAEYARITANVQDVQNVQNLGTAQLSDDGTYAFNAFLASLIYPAVTPGPGAPPTSYFNALRGHDLTSSMYGGRLGSTLPWSGIGLFAEAVTAAEYTGLNRRQIVNYTAFPGMNFLVDPEYSNPAGRPLNAPPTGVYIPKNAPYTYPDVNNFYLASICPATGEILVPSFHRPHLFGSLDPSNPNWTNKQGKFLTLRPRPAEHPNFPPVPQNPDGSYTGDVQNLRGAVGVQKNDSLWMDIGLPPLPAPNGKRYKPLVAPLILDLNGLLDLSSHGNILNGGTHASGAGFGPWEVSLERAFATAAEARNLIQARNGALQNHAGISQRAFAPWMQGQLLPEYMPVPWGGLNGAPALLIPGQGGASLFRDAPVFAHGYDAHNNPWAHHPSLFHPSEWPKTANSRPPRAFSLPDLKLLHFAYAAHPSQYDNLELRQFANATFGLNIPFPDMPIAQTTRNPYRRDPAHRNRMIFTTYSYTLDRPSGLGYYFDGTAIEPHPLADLPPVNLNRPLADYRNDTNQPLSPNNVGNAAQAQQDRQNLARDIFVRLVALTLPDVITSWNPATGQYTFASIFNSAHPNYNDVRTLAQLAVNIVDYIDNDDIMTPFVWHPNPPTDVVWGVERPRLIINEVYSEVTNDPDDPTFGPIPMPAQNPVHVRFWVELHNPTSTPYPADPAGTVGPLGDGSVPLRLPDGGPNYSVYQLLITQNNTQNNANVVSDALRHPVDSAGNNRGEPPVALQKISFDFSPADGTPLQRIAPANGNPDAGMLVLAAHVPNVHAAGEFNPNWPGGAPVLTGAPAGMPNSLTYTVPLNNALVGGNDLNPVIKDHVVLLRRLANPYLPPGPDNPYITVDFMDHVPTFDAIQRAHGAILDRNPKNLNGMAVQPGYDPIDLPAADDPIVRRHAIGKAQPYAGQCNPQPPAPNTAYPQYPFPQSLVLRQAPWDGAGNPVAGVRHTFLRRNSRAPALNGPTFNPGPPADLANDETLMTPYDWLVHLDRPLINTAELLHVQVTKPHLVTHDFMTPRANGSIDKFTGSVQNRLNTGVLSLLYRAFELLRVQPYIAGVPIGGRVPGKINLNTLQDQRVWNALFDAHHNTFDQNFVNQMWNVLIGSRTPNIPTRVAGDGSSHPCPIPGATVFDTNGPAGDRPFLPFGIPTVLPPGAKPVAGSTTATAYGGTLTLNDTILKLNPVTQLPHLLVPPPNALHPYQSAEAFRKILPNITTVSHTFAIWVTIGYFEVEADIPIPIAPGVNIQFHRLGREYFREVPGDTRHQFFAIVDRSMIALDPASYLAFRSGTGSPTHAQQRPFFTTLQSNTPAGSNTIALYAPGGAGWSEGQAVPITPGQRLVIGIGRAMEIVTVQAVGAPQPDGTVVVTLSAPLSFTHYVGDCVSNVVPGNPGPQPEFNVRLPQYQSVVPFWVRLR